MKNLELYLLYFYILSLTCSFFTLNIINLTIDTRPFILLLAIIIFLLKNTPKSLPPLSTLLILFIFSSSISIYLSTNIAHSLEAINNLVIFTIIFIILEILENKNRYKIINIENILILISIIISTQLLTSYINYFNSNITIQISLLKIPIILTPNDTILMAVISPFICLKIEETSLRTIKYILFLILLVNILVSILYLSRSSTIIHIITISLYWILSNRYNILKYLSLLILFIFIIDAFNHFSLLHKQFLSPRLALWWTAWQMFLQYPIFGSGPYTFAHFYQYGVNDIVRPETFKIIDFRIISWPHNLYLELLSERGLTGLSIFLIIIGYSYKKLIIAYQASVKNNKLWLSSLISSLTGMIIAGFIELSLTHFWVGLILVILLARINIVTAVPTN